MDEATQVESRRDFWKRAEGGIRQAQADELLLAVGAYIKARAEYEAHRFDDDVYEAWQQAGRDLEAAAERARRAVQP
jgi:hypothetical protein